MNLFGFSLVVFFVELIFETGRNLKSVAVTGLSIRNLFVYGWLLLSVVKYLGGQRPIIASRLKKTLVIFGLLIFYALISLFFPDIIGLKDYQSDLALSGLKNDLIDDIFIVMVCLSFIKKPQQAIWINRGMLFFAGIASLLTFLDATALHGAVFGLMEYSNRAKGALGEPNQTAVVLSLMFPVALAGIIANKNRIFNMLVAGAMVMALLATGSRGGMVGFLVGSLLLAHLMRRSLSLQKRLMIVVVTVLLVTVAWILLPDFYKEQILSRLNVIADTKSTAGDITAGRTQIWSVVYDVWSLSPIIGVGWYGFKAGLGVATHNLYLEYLVGVGIIGLSLFLFAWFTFIRFVQRSILCCPSELQYILHGFLSGMVGLLVALFTVNLYKPWLVVWVFIAPLTALANLVMVAYMQRLRAQIKDK